SGYRAAALETIQEAVTIRRTLAEASPAAFLPDLAGSLNNLSNRQSDSGYRAAALETIQEAVTHYRTLAEASPAAFLPDLAMSLNNLSIQQSDSGDREAALKSIQEAVTIRRTLAEASPAAFLPDLATSLNNLADLLEGLKRAGEVAGVWSGIASGLRPGAQAECLLQLAVRQSASGHSSDAAETFTRAVRCATADENPQWRGRARRALQRVAAQLTEAGTTREGWPHWVVGSLSDVETERLNRWLAASDWQAKSAFLRAEHTALSGDDGRAALDLARAWYPEVTALEELSEVLDAIGEDGLDRVLSARTAQDRHVTLIRAWLNTPDWAQSRAFLRTNRSELARPETVALLSDAKNEVTEQHAAILELLESLELDEVFDAVTDVTVAADHGYRFVEAGALDKLSLLWQAAPRLTSTRFAAPFLAAVAAVLREAPSEAADPEAWMRAAGESATDTQRGAGVGRLRRMARRYPVHAAALENLIEALESTPATEAAEM
ncbi:hypothetical protein AB0I81_63315, partial [Nonomuraea sp. NPDC050404]|uniref:hypothetical protein n=1 Tax=Nonomuraea sp. NPDC050404 TaxID=3155783 RepID=UPI0033C80BA1